MVEENKGGVNPEATDSRKEKNQKKRHCLFLSGFNGTYAGIRGIKEGLEQQYGAGNVSEFNSVISPDPQNPQRFIQIADVIQKRAKDGLDIVAHSLGAAELQKALMIIRKKDEKFFDNEDVRKNLRIALIAPAGFSKGIKNSFRYMGRTLRFLYNNGDLPISKSDTFLRGMDALTAFPPKGVSPDVLSDALRKAARELSQYKSYEKIIPLGKEKVEKEDVGKEKEEKGYISNLSPDMKKKVEEHGELIRIAIESKKYAELRRLVSSYGKLLRQPLGQVFAGNFEKTNAPVREAVRATVGGYLGLLTTLIDAYGSKPMKEIARLEKKGVRVDFIIPEYDVFMKLSEAIKFFNNTHVSIAEGVPHSYIALISKYFAETIKNLWEDKVKAP